MLVYTLFAGILFGLYFSLVGLGLNLVFGVMRIVNLAHGDMLMLGAFVALGVVGIAKIDPLFAVPLAFVIFVIAGLLLYWVLVPRLQGSANPEMLSIILFFFTYGETRYDPTHLIMIRGANSVQTEAPKH